MFVGNAPDLTYPSCFFDGATTNNIGGDGIFLLINQSHFFCIKMGCGHNTNTRVELLSLWDLLHFAKEIGIPTLYVYGDSFVIINWANEKAALFTLDLDGWCDDIVELKAYFPALDFHHVFWEQNKRADNLSKEALPMASSLLSFTEYYEEIAIEEDKLQLF